MASASTPSSATTISGRGRRELAQTTVIPLLFGLIRADRLCSRRILAKRSRQSRSGPIPTTPRHKAALELAALLRSRQGPTAPPGGGWAPPGVDTLLPGAVDLEPVPLVKWTRSTITTTITR